MKARQGKLNYHGGVGAVDDVDEEEREEGECSGGA